MTVSGVSGVNSLQFLRAQNAFKQDNINTEKLDSNKGNFDEEDVKVTISSKNINNESELGKKEQESGILIKEQKYVGELKDFLNNKNLAEIDDRDIEEALTNGTSILANYVA